MRYKIITYFDKMFCLCDAGQILEVWFYKACSMDVKQLKIYWCSVILMCISWSVKVSDNGDLSWELIGLYSLSYRSLVNPNPNSARRFGNGYCFHHQVFTVNKCTRIVVRRTVGSRSTMRVREGMAVYKPTAIIVEMVRITLLLGCDPSTSHKERRDKSAPPGSSTSRQF